MIISPFLGLGGDPAGGIADFSHPFRRNGWLSITLCVSFFVSFFVSTHFFSTLSKVSSIQLPQVTGARHSLLLFSAGHPSKY